MLLQKQNFLRQLEAKDEVLVKNKKKLVSFGYSYFNLVQGGTLLRSRLHYFLQVTAQRKKYSTQQKLKQELKREKELEAAIAEKQSLILDMEDKVKAIKATNEKLTIANAKLKEKIATHKVPSIDEYINLKIQLEEEQRRTKVFERKINIKKLIERNQTIKKIRAPQPFVRRQDIVL